MSDEHDELVIKILTIVILGILLFTSVVSITLVALLTERDVGRAEGLTFGGVILLCTLGGLSWWTIRRRRKWKLNLERENGNASDDHGR